MGKGRPYILSLVGIYCLALPFLTKGFLDESNSSHYKYAYWVTFAATPLLPLCCLLGFIHFGLCIGFYVEQKNNPGEQFHGLFISGTIPTICIVALALSVVWQAVLKGLNYNIGIPPHFSMLTNQKRWLYYVSYLLCTMMSGIFFTIFAGKEYFWAFYILPLKVTLLYWLWFLFAKFSTVRIHWLFAREIFFLGFAYLLAAIPSFILFFSIPNSLTQTTRNIFFFVGILGLSCIAGAFLCIFTSAFGECYSDNQCTRHWVRSIAYYFALGLLLNYGFTKAIRHEEYEEYGYYTIIFMLLFYISFKLCLMSRGYSKRHYISAFFAFLPISSPFLFCSFWIWTQGFNNYDGLSHFLYVAGLQNFTCLFSILFGMLWREIMKAITIKIDLDLKFPLSRLT